MAKTFGEVLRNHRLSLGYGLRQFAELLGEHPGNYANVESGTRAPWRDVDRQITIAKALGLTPESPEWNEFFRARGGSGRRGKARSRGEAARGRF